MLALLLLGSTACTGGEETVAQTTESDSNNPAPKPLNASERLGAINRAIPVYENATYQGELTRRDTVLVSNRYGKDALVYTLATEDSFPQVWHYYVTYLAQFRQFDPPDSYPPSRQTQRMMEVVLNDAMRDPFGPGDSFDPSDRQVILQIIEDENSRGTLIRRP